MGAAITATAFAMLQVAMAESAVVGSLPVLPNAVEVDRRSNATTPSVAYDIRETYPAPQTIGLLVDAVAKGGWLLAEDAAARSAARRRILQECEAGRTVSPECEK